MPQRKSSSPPVCLAGLVAVAALLLTACAEGTSAEPRGQTGSAERYPLTVENCGHEVTVDAPPGQVVLLASAPVTILAGLGVFERVVSRAGSFPLEYYDEGLGRQVESVESFSDDIDASGHLMISQEEVIAQSPDLVLGLPDGVSREGLADFGAAVLTQELYCRDGGTGASFDDVYAEIERYGEIFGEQARADQLNADLAERVAAVEAQAQNEDRTAAVVYPSVGGGPLYVYGTGSMAHPQLESAGFENVFSETEERVFEVQTEELIDRDPDTIIVLYQGDQQDAEDAVMQRSGIEGVSAISEGNIQYQLFNYTEPASPLVIDGLERIAAHFGDGG